MSARKFLKIKASQSFINVLLLSLLFVLPLFAIIQKSHQSVNLPARASDLRQIGQLTPTTVLPQPLIAEETWLDWLLNFWEKIIAFFKAY